MVFFTFRNGSPVNQGRLAVEKGALGLLTLLVLDVRLYNRIFYVRFFFVSIKKRSFEVEYGISGQRFVPST